ncbi:putative alcohol dehydrogenase [Pseudovirgaria hyperparasitica]|uniref:Putative alcohol dehydrogenase n=1 Tax=Pseudovirgaria hyperparasitica TaxID=470096 RepID=A0A6A6VUB8_9PEZI|nr:putative alcohol dehydrogenase [Pseudovirgaria hyperparasitica]KAF2753210.1 putative alcohol dehydrogenase [Pseudovirgaria hyperparasitica]
MKALIFNGKDAQLVTDRKRPALRNNFILIRTIAVALNPYDWKTLDYAMPGCLIGCDFAGTVEEVGPGVTKPWKQGDRVCGTAHGVNATQPEDGAFAEWIVAKGDVCMRIPASMSFEEASGIGMAAITSGQAMFQKMEMSLPTKPIEKKEYLLVYGGSTVCGTLAVQYANIAGYSVITTCSPRNFELCTSRGAEATFDYNDPDCGQKIHDFTKGKLKLCYDTIGSDEGIQICMTALTTESGSRYGTLAMKPIPRQDVIYTDSICLKALGEDIPMFPVTKEDYDFGKLITGATEQLLADQRLRPHPIKKCEKGLAGIIDGIDFMKTGQVSGEKLVYVVSETP